MAFNIWRITDGKAGHDTQSIGLCNAIEKLKPCQRFDITAETTLSKYKNLLLKQFPNGKDLPKPNIIIGAGHGTHLSMLNAKRTLGGKTIVLMKPSLPISLFDACIIPEHDEIDKENVISTKGAINPVQFNENKSINSGLFLLGGPSSHYQWDNENIIKQIKQIVANNPDLNWHIADSPRTPETTLESLVGLNGIDILNHKETSSETIRELIFNTGIIWVSVDSVSMIYESLSSGASVGILDVREKNKNKISNFINNLFSEQQLTSFQMWEKTNKLFQPTIKFNEADRCAKILSERGLLS
jgi:mitochondrial fission protein ELM1